MIDREWFNEFKAKALSEMEKSYDVEDEREQFDADENVFDKDIELLDELELKCEGLKDEYGYELARKLWKDINCERVKIIENKLDEYSALYDRDLVDEVINNHHYGFERKSKNDHIVWNLQQDMHRRMSGWIFEYFHKLIKFLMNKSDNERWIKEVEQHWYDGYLLTSGHKALLEALDDMLNDWNN